MKIAVSGERLGRALPSTLNSSINYFRPVSVRVEHIVDSLHLVVRSLELHWCLHMSKQLPSIWVVPEG